MLSSPIAIAKLPYGRFLRLSAKFYATNGPSAVSGTIEKSAETRIENSFSVFPSIKNVKPEEILGNTKFGYGTYFVGRTSTGNLPVYSDYKAGGNKVVTEIRKIQGDIIQLRNDIQNELPHVPKDSWKVLMQSKKILIKGEHVQHVKKILEKKF